MAKKKTKDTKGLAGIVNKVPREVDINGQLHMLAWITPKEGQTLKQLGGAGTLGPMGIPQYGYGDDDGSGGYGDGDSDTGGMGSGDSDTGGGDPGGGNDDNSSSSDGPSGGNDNSDDDRDDIESEAYTSAMLEEAGYTPQGTLAGEGETALGRMSRLGLTPEQYSLTQRGLAIKDLDPSSKEGFTLSQIENLNKRIGRTTDIFGINQKIKDALLSQQGRNVYTDKAGNIVGVTHQPTDKFGSTLANILNAIGLKPGVSPDNLYNEQLVYTGASQFDPFGAGGGRDDGRDNGLEKNVVVTATDAAVSAVPTSPPSYYGQGVGTATTNLYDPTKIDPYLASLYGITPSPIGATYDAATSSYYMPGSKKDAKSRTRLRGLDIFKPISTI